MWFLDKQHPNFFARQVAKLVWFLVSVITVVAVCLIVVWCIDAFGGKHYFDAIKDGVNWVRSGHWKQAAAGLITILVAGPLILDMLFGTPYNQYGGGYGYGGQPTVYNDNRRIINNRRGGNPRNRNEPRQ